MKIAKKMGSVKVYPTIVKSRVYGTLLNAGFLYKTPSVCAHCPHCIASRDELKRSEVITVQSSSVSF